MPESEHEHLRCESNLGRLLIHLQMARVVRDKHSTKTKGYGFVSFKDPWDMTKCAA